MTFGKEKCFDIIYIINNLMLRYIYFLFFFPVLLFWRVYLIHLIHFLLFRSFIEFLLVSCWAICFSDGRYFPWVEHARLRCHQVDPSHGILYHFQFSPHEDVEVVYNFFFLNNIGNLNLLLNRAKIYLFEIFCILLWCRVSLTYRVKSAHKLKLTDQQLLQWMVPIMLVATVYLGAWTASDPPTGEYILTGPTMKFTQCTYNWWDHSLAIGKQKNKQSE